VDAEEEEASKRSTLSGYNQVAYWILAQQASIQWIFEALSNQLIIGRKK